jgi:Fic family protein
MRSRYLDIDDRIQDLAEILRDDPAIAGEFLRKYEISWIFHENALEGLVFSRPELETALTTQPLTDVASINALREIRNFKAAVEVVRTESATRRPKITQELVTRLYETLQAGIESRAATGFRKDIPLHRAYFHEIAQPGRVAGQLAELLHWTESGEFRGMHVVQRASRLHHGFMQIYPYTDGSGKIARLLANLVLMHADYQPCVIHAIDRQRYYESLKLPESSLRELMLESIENGLTTAEKFVRSAGGEMGRGRSLA